MHGINKTVGVYWINLVYKTSGYSPIGLETAFPSDVEQEEFEDKQEWIDRCNELGITVDEEYLD